MAGHEVACAPVPARLAPFVSSWIGYREWSLAPVERLEHPTGRAVLIFELGTPLEVGRSAQETTRFRAGFFAGIDDAPSFTAFQGTQAGIQVNLTPRGAHALTGFDTPDLTRQVVDIGALRLWPGLCDQLADATDWSERFALVLHVLAPRFERAKEQSSVVRWALHRIDASLGAVRIEHLSHELGFSRKHLHDRFIREVGLPPKRYAALRRFDHVVQRLRAGSVESFASLAAEAGYADQSHLAREVRRFSGRSTTELALSLHAPLGQAIEDLTSSLE